DIRASIMNILGQKLASIRPAHTVCTPAAVCDDTAVCDHTFATGFGEVPRPDAPLVSALPFSEMEGVLLRGDRRDTRVPALRFRSLGRGLARESGAGGHDRSPLRRRS